MMALVGFDGEYDKVADYLLGDVLVVDTMETALSVWKAAKTRQDLVTLDGEVLDPQGVVTGGRRRTRARVFCLKSGKSVSWRRWCQSWRRTPKRRWKR